MADSFEWKTPEVGTGERCYVNGVCIGGYMYVDKTYRKHLYCPWRVFFFKDVPRGLLFRPLYRTRQAARDRVERIYARMQTQ